MHFAVLPDERAAQHPDRPALADPHHGELTNAQLFERVQSMAHHFSDAGVDTGDVVAVKLANRVELIVALFAAWRLGAAATPVNPALTPGEVEYQLSDSAARVLVSEEDASSPGGCRVLTLDELSRPAGSPGRPVNQSAEDAVALLVYTSGTTGRPKGVELTHANITAMARAMISFTGIDASDHSLLILPLFHVNGIVVSVLAPLLAGGRATIAGRFDPRTFFGIVEKVRPTMFSAVPTIYGML